MRVSYSTLKKVVDGDLEGAYQSLMGIEGIVSEKMLEGKNLHKRIEEKKLILLPASDKLLFEHKVEMKLERDLVLVGVIDLYDQKNQIIYDWKYTSRKIVEYDEMQLLVYSILVPEARLGVLVKIDKEPKVKEMYGKELNDRTRKKATEWIIRNSNILKEYIKNGQQDSNF
jgi:hypothetical protein